MLDAVQMQEIDDKITQFAKKHPDWENPNTTIHLLHTETPDKLSEAAKKMGVSAELLVQWANQSTEAHELREADRIAENMDDIDEINERDPNR